MDYETVTTETKLAQANQAIANQEAQHYQLVLEKIANAANKAAVDNLDAQLRVREAAIVGLRAERDRLRADQEPAAAAAGYDASSGSAPDASGRGWADASSPTGTTPAV